MIKLEIRTFDMDIFVIVIHDMPGRIRKMISMVVEYAKACEIISPSRLGPLFTSNFSMIFKIYHCAEKWRLMIESR